MIRIQEWSRDFLIDYFNIRYERNFLTYNYLYLQAIISLYHYIYYYYYFVHYYSQFLYYLVS